MATIKDRYILEVDTKGASANIGSTTGAIGGMAAGLARLGPLAAAAGAAIAGIAAVQSIGNKIQEFDDLAKAARQAGAAGDAISFEQFQVFGQVLEEAGVGADRFSLALSQTQDRLAKGGGKIDGVIEKLGGSIRDMNGELLGGPELLEKMIIAFNTGQISAEEFQATVGTKVGPEIIRALGDTAASAESLQAAMQDVAANSNIVDLEAAENAEKFGDTMARLQEVAGRLGTEIVSKLLPPLLELAEGALEMLPGFIDGVKQAFETLEPVFSLIGTVATELLIPALKLIFEVLGEVASVVAPLAEAAIPALRSGFEALGNAVSSIIDFFRSAAETLQNIYDKAIQLKNGVTDAFGSMKDSVVGSAKGAYDGVTGWFGDMYDEVVGNSIVPDMAKGVLTSFDGMSNGMVSKIGDAIPAVLDSFRDIASNISERFESLTGLSVSNIRSQVGTLADEVGSRIGALTNSISSKFSDIATSVGGFVNDIGVGDFFNDVASSVGSGFSEAQDNATNFFKGINNSFANSFDNNMFDGFFDNLSSKFAGGFATGGFIPNGQFGLVGERGPELISGPAQITPFVQTSAQPVTYNINAVDARSFKQLIAREPEFIHAVAQKGATRVPRRR